MFANISSHTNVAPSDRGIVLCSSNKMIPDVLKMIFQIRHIHKSSMQFAVFHCGEIEQESQDLITRVSWQTVRFFNLCDEPIVAGMSLDSARYHLRGFMCKIGAVIRSPFNETMLMDLDVVLFKQPERLFESKQYEATGTLFFRDRVYYETAKSNFPSWLIVSHFERHNLTVNNKSALPLAYKGGISFFWRSIARSDKEYPWLSDYGESSVVLIDKRKHPELLSIFELVLRNSDDMMGYGDKENFWIGATMAMIQANEPFSFEPYLAGQYGDCFGVVMHHDPIDGTPLYINAEYLVEDETTSLGQFVQSEATLPVLVRDPFMPLTDLNTWSKSRDEAGCSCNVPDSIFTCNKAPHSILHHLLLAQWMTLTLRLEDKSSRGVNDVLCVPVHVKFASMLAEAFAYIGIEDNSAELCKIIGCPRFPFNINTSLPWPQHGPQYCELITFTNTTEDLPLDKVLDARSPTSSFNRPKFDENTLLQAYGQKAVYLFSNGSLHLIPSLAVFMTLVPPRDFSEVIQIPLHVFDSLPKGKDVDSARRRRRGFRT